MNFLDKLFGKKTNNTNSQDIKQTCIDKNSSINDPSALQTTEGGFVSITKIQINNNTLNALKRRYIAFDVETTGLNPCNDRIIEVGAVLFENGVPVKKYGTLVNAMISIPSSVSAVNHISNQMIKSAPSEGEAYKNLIEFLGDALQKKTAICAHNARFDLDFLAETFKRIGYNADIRYIDTLSLSRRFVKGLVNYKQDTVAEYFSLYNSNAHRAVSDAEICGSILWNLLEIMEEDQEKARVAMEKNRPSSEEIEVCAVIQNMIASRNGTTDLLGFYKNSSGYVEVCYLYNIIKFKFAKKGKYIIVEKSLKGIENYIKEPCTMSEGGSDFIRLFFNSPLDLEMLGDYIFEKYKAIRKSALDYFEYNTRYLSDYKNSAIMNNAFSASDIEHILLTIYNKDYQIQNVVINSDDIIDRANIDIHPINNRVPISQIMNLNNWDKGFDKGYPFWEKGEEYRKRGDILEAINLYDKARFYGYCAPALFESYAMAFHKISDYDNEIEILNEGIERIGKRNSHINRMITRRNNAIKMLLIQREKEQSNKAKKEKQILHMTTNEFKGEKSTKKRAGRPVLQMDDDMNIIEQFETIAEACRKTGINSKSIRDAAKGIQKHAGNFVWRYVDEYESK